MSSQTLQNKRSGYGSNVSGKSVIVSIPAHELHLIDEWERLAHLEMTSKSQYFRKCLRREIARVDEQFSQKHCFQ